MTRDHAHFGDQVGYSPALVEAYIPAIFDDSWVLQPRLRTEAATGVKAKVDPRHIPDHLLQAADVQIGYRRAGLDETEKACLRAVYHEGWTPGELSVHWGVASEQIHTTCEQAIYRISQYLSGRSPK